MMSTSQPPRELVARLERLGGDATSCCVPEYADAAANLRAARAFDTSLAGYKALADENRLLAMALLARRRELCACEIQAATGLTHATVSHHMRVLEAAGLVRSRRSGKWVYYAIEGSGEVALP